MATVMTVMAAAAATARFTAAVVTVQVVAVLTVRLADAAWNKDDIGPQYVQNYCRSAVAREHELNSRQNGVIKYYRLTWQRKLVTIKSLKANASSVRAIDEGLTLEMSVFKLFTVANIRY